MKVAALGQLRNHSWEHWGQGSYLLCFGGWDTIRCLPIRCGSRSV